MACVMDDNALASAGAEIFFAENTLAAPPVIILGKS
jgi:hypothetical protein